MSTQHKLIIAAVAVVLIGGSFYAGVSYAKSKTPVRGQFNSAQFMGAQGQSHFMRGGMGGSAGQIVSVDSSSMTIKLQNGSTQIVLLSASTTVQKSVTGTVHDLAAGQDAIITGATNSDGSITAQSVQLRPMPVRTQQ